MWRQNLAVNFTKLAAKFQNMMTNE